MRDNPNLDKQIYLNNQLNSFYELKTEELNYLYEEQTKELQRSATVGQSQKEVEMIVQRHLQDVKDWLSNAQ